MTLDFKSPNTPPNAKGRLKEHLQCARGWFANPCLFSLHVECIGSVRRGAVRLGPGGGLPRDRRRSVVP
jgi:hypothetical protein